MDRSGCDHDRSLAQQILSTYHDSPAPRIVEPGLRVQGMVGHTGGNRSAPAYEQQSAGYDAEAGGGLFAADEPVVAEYLSRREPARADPPLPLLVPATFSTGATGREARPWCQVTVLWGQ
jgi:hypothetical protein